jgi:hypothetical protein
MFLVGDGCKIIYIMLNIINVFPFKKFTTMILEFRKNRVRDDETYSRQFGVGLTSRLREVHVS